MTITDTIAHLPGPEYRPIEDRYDFALPSFDLYRDIHKGIRAELFAITSSAGSVAPSDRPGRLDLAEHVSSVGALLGSHAAHEDELIDPPLAEHAPELAARVEADHHVLEAHFAWITERALDSADAVGSEQRRLAHLLYLELTGFTSAYLTHQLVEERVVMPALEAAMGIDAVLAVHGAILASIPPAEMARSLAFMLPAMNLDDRTDMLMGMRMAAPFEAYRGVVDLARSILHPADFTALAARLD